MKKRFLIILSIVFSFLLLLFISIKALDLINYKCIYRRLFNFYCAGCGTTRMIKAIFHFKFYQAFRYNPVMFILMITGILYAIYLIIYYIKYGKLKLLSIKIIIIIIVILFIYSLLRNIPYFYFFRPTIV